MKCRKKSYTTTKWLVMTWKWNMETNNPPHIHTQTIAVISIGRFQVKLLVFCVLGNYYGISCDIIVICVRNTHFCGSIQLLLWIYKIHKVYEYLWVCICTEPVPSYQILSKVCSVSVFWKAVFMIPKDQCP